MQSTTKTPDELAPRPAGLDATGLPPSMLEDLVLKHLAQSGVAHLGILAARLGLAGSLAEEILARLRSDGQVQVFGAEGGSPFLRFGLTEQGRVTAADAAGRDGYVGPAPVPLAEYERVVRAQSRRLSPLTRTQVHEAFSDTVIRPSLLDRLGPAVNSGRPLFIYGPAGTGKSFIARRLSRLLGPPVLVPHAVAIDDSTVRCLDPGVHHKVDGSAPASALLSQGFDARYVLCERPTVIAGGELTIDMLDLHHNDATRLYRAPLQMRANNGLLLLDDLGRQRVSPAALFNRWIIPLEEGRDHLALKGGQHFTIPFDLVLVLSTNLDPLSLADDAFLRRMGYKIEFAPSTPEEYSAIFEQECARNGLDPAPELAGFLMDELHAKHGVALLPCHPRDLLGLALDHVRYTGAAAVDEDTLRWAWNNYFVGPGPVDPEPAEGER
jgi:predicted ATPase with chaperone activity